ncbi:MAG: alpha/beta hydrolase, partial [SAR202 cluster bacterium]|nr:alpha/beta hydrolase [SAR202 cluster bacterium]
YVMAGDIKTHYVDAGDGDRAVVLLHGGGPGSGGAVGFRFLIPALAEAGYRVYAPDQVSYGLTDAPPSAYPRHAHQSLVDHVKAWMDALCLDKVFMVGNSQGAYVAAKYAWDAPGRVEKLVFIGSGTISQAMGLKTTVTEGHVALREFDGSERGMRRFLESIVHDKSTVTPNLVSTRTRAYNRPGIPEATKAFDAGRATVQNDQASRANFMLTDKLPKMTQPMLFVWGNDDAFAPVTLGHQLKEMLPNIRFQFVDGAGHQVQTDQPALFNKSVIDFFGK